MDSFEEELRLEVVKPETVFPTVDLTNDWRRAVNKANLTNKWLLLFFASRNILSSLIERWVFDASQDGGFIQETFVVFHGSNRSSEVIRKLIPRFKMYSLPFLAVVHPVSELIQKEISVGKADRYPEYASVVRGRLMELVSNQSTPIDVDLHRKIQVSPVMVYLKLLMPKKKKNQRLKLSKSDAVKEKKDVESELDRQIAASSQPPYTSITMETDLEEHEAEVKSDTTQADTAVVRYSASMMPNEGPTPDQISLLFCNRDAQLIAINSFRKLVGIKSYVKHGHFVDVNMAGMVSSYVNWMPYPKGNATLAKYLHWITKAVISEDGGSLFTASDSTVIHWSLINHGLKKELECGHSVSLMANSGYLLATARVDSSLQLWDLRKYKVIRELDMGFETAECMTFINQGKSMMIGDSHGTIRVWSTENGFTEQYLKLETDYPIDMITAKDESILVCLTNKNLIQVRQLRSSLLISEVGQHRRVEGLFALSVNPDQSKIAVVSHSVIETMNLDACAPSLTPQIRGTMSCACFHPFHPDVMAVGTSYGSISIVQLQPFRVIMTMKDHSDAVIYVAFTPDSQRLISVSYYDSIRIWDICEQIDAFITRSKSA